MLQIILITGIAMIVVHEAGHFILASFCKLHPKIDLTNLFRLKNVVRYDLPTTDRQRRLISQAGFVAEFLFGTALVLSNMEPEAIPIFTVLFLIHFTAYPWTARYDTGNDFNGLGSIEKEKSDVDPS